MRANLAKRRLREGKSNLGVHIPFPAPIVVAFAGAAGFHWVLIDCEHGPMNHEAVATMIRAAEWAGITSRWCARDTHEYGLGKLAV